MTARATGAANAAARCLTAPTPPPSGDYNGHGNLLGLVRRRESREPTPVGLRTLADLRRPSLACQRATPGIWLDAATALLHDPVPSSSVRVAAVVRADRLAAVLTRG